MKIKLSVLLILFILFAATVHSKDASQDTKGAVAFMPELGFEFDSVIEGTIIAHNFIIQNKGDAPLNIIKVKTT